jgi:hypothetical protein
MPHHDSVLSQRLNQRASTRATEDFFNEIGPERLMTEGRAWPLCPGRSDINLFRYGECVVYLDPEITDSALDLRVAEQELDSPKVAGASVDQCRFGSAQGMRAKHFWIKPNARHPIGKKSGKPVKTHGRAALSQGGQPRNAT